MKYLDLLEECRQIYTELSYNSRFVRISMFHLIGKTLLENSDVVEGKLEKFALALNVSLSDISRAILFANDYPNLEDFNHDKTISWQQIKDSYAKNKEA